MKLLDILQSASSNIWQSKLRTILTIIAVFIGAFTLTLTTGIGSGISQYIDSQLGNFGGKNLLVIQAKNRTSVISSGDAPAEYDPNKVTTSLGFGGGDTVTVLTGKDVDKIKALDGITSVDTVQSINAKYIYAPGSDKKYEVSLQQYYTGTTLAMNAGTIPNNDSSELQFELPYNYSKTLGFDSYADAIGKKVKIGIADPSGVISDVEATIVGVPQKSLLTTTGGAYINQALLQALTKIQNSGLPAASLDKHAALVAYFDTSYNATQITDLKSRLDKAGYSAQTTEDRIGILKQVVNGIVIVFDMFAIIALIAAIFGVINTLLMSVQERTKEIGLMKAMGMSRNKIFLLFSTEAILLGFWGSAIGAIAAIGVGNLISNYASKGFLKDFDGLNLLAFTPLNILGIIVAIMFIAFLAGTLPARRAARLDPINSLRYE